MTVVVYKDNVLAADTRRSKGRNPHSEEICGHCGEEGHLVKDDVVKLRLVRKGVFRGEKIRASAGAGNVELLSRLQSVVATGDDLEATYASFLRLHGRHTENEERCVLMLIGETKNFTVRVPERGELIVKEYPKDRFLAIGSGDRAAIWINKLLPVVTAQQIVNLAMDGDLSVGGSIDVFDFNEEKPEIRRFEKTDPGSMIEIVRAVYMRGIEVMGSTK